MSIVYTNVLHIVVNENWNNVYSSSTRVYEYLMEIRCALGRISTQSSSGYGTGGMQLEPEVNARDFRLKIEVFRDLGMTEKIDTQDTVEIGVPLWTKISVTESVEDTALELTVTKCYIKTKNESRQTRQIMDKSCPTDSSIEIISRSNLKEVAFSFQTFMFQNDKSGIFVECVGILCNKEGLNNANPECICKGVQTAGCTSLSCPAQHKKSRSRAAEREIEWRAGIADELKIQFGPFYVKLPKNIDPDSFEYINGVIYLKNKNGSEAVKLDGNENLQESLKKEGNNSIRLATNENILFLFFVLVELLMKFCH